MKLLRGFEDPDLYQGGFVSIGNFDGVHRGHQQIMATLVRQARAQDVPAVALTFDPHPITLLRPADVPPSLSSLDRKVELLARCGVDCVIAYPTDHALLNLSPDEFFDRIVRTELRAKGLVEGPNFFFGHDRAGDVKTLRVQCEAAGLTLDVVEPLAIEGRLVSSSIVRSLVAEGRLGEAVELLGHPYRIRGRVSRGAGRGATLGFPTANLAGMETLIPEEGAYAGVAQCGQQRRPAAIHIGPNPTFREMRSKIEVHLIDYSGDLYGQSLDVDILKRLRGVTAFEDVGDLQNQLEQDVKAVRALVEGSVSMG